MLYTNKLRTLSMSDPCIASTFLGVFPSNRLPRRIPTYPASLIANTDPASQPGEHWIAMYFPDKTKSEFFDSYGFPPSFYSTHFTKYLSQGKKRTGRNKTSLQSLNSFACGYYCLYYLYFRTRGKSMKAIEQSFTPKNKQANDAHVEGLSNITWYLGVVVAVVRPSVTSFRIVINVMYQESNAVTIVVENKKDEIVKDSSFPCWKVSQPCRRSCTRNLYSSHRVV